jgi:ATP-dependent DNA helicase RecG
MAPHYLIMTATPIPRTLALSYFADFDVTTLDELPPGRQPIKTRWLPSAQAGQAYEFVRKQVSTGRQAYLIVPQIDETGAGDDAKSVVAEFKRLSTGPLAGCRLAMLHGQMSTDEKQATMAAFRDREIDVLIATTVIEVGIDVPNATVIVIDNADGFEIAETDLKLRGPGEFFGTRQHGLPEFKLADITAELELLAQAKEDALAMLAADPRLTAPAYRHLRKALLERFGETMALAQIG